jgi:hypothetical protein
MVTMWPPVMWLSSAQRRRARRQRRSWPRRSAAAIAAGEQADRGALDIAFAAGDLAGEAQARIAPSAQPLVEQLRRVQ